MLSVKSRRRKSRERSRTRLVSDWIGDPRPGCLESRSLTSGIVFYRAIDFDPIEAQVFDMGVTLGSGVSLSSGDPEATAVVLSSQSNGTGQRTITNVTRAYNRLIDPGPATPPNGAGTSSIEVLVHHYAKETVEPYFGTEDEGIPAYQSYAASPPLQWQLQDLDQPGAPVTPTTVHVSFDAGVTFANPNWRGGGGLTLRSNLINVDIDLNVMSYLITDGTGATVESGNFASTIHVEFDVTADHVDLWYTSLLSETQNLGTPAALAGYEDFFSWNVFFASP